MSVSYAVLCSSVLMSVSALRMLPTKATKFLNDSMPPTKATKFLNNMDSELNMDFQLNNVELAVPDKVNFNKETQQEGSFGSLAEIHVINLDARHDRCECMKSQLVDSPYPIFRQSGATVKDYHEKCPSVVKEGHFSFAAQGALFCSSRLIWQKVNEKMWFDKPRFLIILEDDVGLAPDFSHRLQSFLESKCMDTSFDMLAVDTFSFDGNTRNRNQQQCTANGMQHNIMNYDAESRYGTHFLIVPTQSLPKLLLQKGHVVDAFDKYKNMTVKFWNPRMAGQGSAGPGSGKMHGNKQLAKCKPSVQTSDVKGFARAGMHSLECPA